MIGWASVHHYARLGAHGVVPLDYHQLDLAEAIRRGWAGRPVRGPLRRQRRAPARACGPPRRINTTIDFRAAELHGAQADGEGAASTPRDADRAGRADRRGPRRGTDCRRVSLERVRDSDAELEQHHPRAGSSSSTVRSWRRSGLMTSIHAWSASWPGGRTGPGKIRVPGRRRTRTHARPDPSRPGDPIARGTEWVPGEKAATRAAAQDPIKGTEHGI